MNANLSFSTLSLFYITLLMLLFFLRERIKSLENKIYSYIIISNFIGVILAILCHYFILNAPDTFLAMVVSKGLLVYYLTWITFFTLYVFIVSSKNEEKEKKYKIYLRRFAILYLIIFIFIMTLPLYFHNENGIVYSYGPSANLLYVIVPLYMTVFFICMLRNLKILRNRKFLPLFAFLIIGSVVTVVQKLNPGLLLITSTETFITFLMYFTIENPDVKMINELNKNRVLVNQTMEDKSNFLFLASNQLKKPVDEIKNIADLAINLTDVEELQKNLKAISNKSHDLSMYIHNVMDISSLTNSNIKMIPEKYNLKNLLAKIKIVESKKVTNNVEFIFNVSDNIPEYLYGDSKLLEQILISTIENAIKYTKSGFIELRLNTIVKYDMARLIFTIEDSGQGITIDKVNELLMLDSELSNEELKRLETNNVNVNTIKKLISKLGGYFTIKSEVNKGTEIKFVIDQKIITENQVNVNSLTTKDKVLIATQDKDLMHQMIYILDNRGYDIETSIYSNDILDRIRLHEEYSYIFIDDNMDKRAIEVLKELKKNPKFKMKVVVILGKDLDLIKEHFIKDGFNNYIMKDNLESELERVLD